MIYITHEDFIHFVIDSADFIFVLYKFWYGKHWEKKEQQMFVHLERHQIYCFFRPVFIMNFNSGNMLLQFKKTNQTEITNNERINYILHSRNFFFCSTCYCFFNKLAQEPRQFYAHKIFKWISRIKFWSTAKFCSGF